MQTHIDSSHPHSHPHPPARDPILPDKRATRDSEEESHVLRTGAPKFSEVTRRRCSPAESQSTWGTWMIMRHRRVWICAHLRRVCVAKSSTPAGWLGGGLKFALIVQLTPVGSAIYSVTPLAARKLFPPFPLSEPPSFQATR